MLLMLHGQQQQQQSCYLTEKMFSFVARCWRRRRLHSSSKGRRWRCRSTCRDSLAGFRSNVILSSDFQTIFSFRTFQNGFLTTNCENWIGTFCCITYIDTSIYNLVHGKEREGTKLCSTKKMFYTVSLQEHCNCDSLCSLKANAVCFFILQLLTLFHKLFKF